MLLLLLLLFIYLSIYLSIFINYILLIINTLSDLADSDLTSLPDNLNKLRNLKYL